MRFAVDFDGTLAVDMWPKIGAFVPGAVETCRTLQALGHEVYLWTMRHDDRLQAVIDYCATVGLHFDGVNKAPNRRPNEVSNKLDADVFIDDRALGTPLVMFSNGKKMKAVVDWARIRNLLRERFDIPL